MTTTRPCVVRHEVFDSKCKGSSKYRTVEKPAIFHRFGDISKYINEVEAFSTVAIVELKESGVVLSLDPEKVRFTDSCEE